MLNLKKLGVLFLVGIFVVGFMGLSNEMVEGAEYTLRVAHADPTDVYESRTHGMAMTFKHLVETESGNRIEVEVMGDGAVGGEREYVESIMAGTIEAGIASGVMAGFLDEAMVTEIPFLFADERVAWEVLDGPLGDELSQLLLEETGNLRNLTFGEVGHRHFTNSERPIHTPEDMEGLDFRVMETPIYMELVEALGGNPTPVAWPETYSALEQGVVDGQENPVDTIVFANFDEVQDYLTLTGHVYGVDWFVINNDFYENLPEELQNVVQSAADRAVTVGRGLSQLNSALGMETLDEAGMDIYNPTPEELEQFREAGQGPVVEWLREQMDEDIIDMMFEEVEKVEEELGL